ncbi:hypothetical protein BJV38_001023 [Clostridium beijerinckii]|nr:hypothetical protein [Clostridium beijerinckii]NRT44180.1 hypothetical protein [Clostridium beijerinckii]NYC71616.1 hypothetical protein [Clostridium beijerinckii]
MHDAYFNFSSDDEIDASHRGLLCACDDKV